MILLIAAEIEPVSVDFVVFEGMGRSQRSVGCRQQQFKCSYAIDMAGSREICDPIGQRWF